MKPELLDSLSRAVLSDMAGLLCDQPLGEGIGRRTFVFGLDYTKVIKIEDSAGSFQNVMEWETWQSLEGTPYDKWLAPCRHISPCGTILIMDRTRPPGRGELPKKLPEWLSDHKLENYGFIKSRFVCHDYGTNLLLNHGAYKPMSRRNIDWSWDE